MSAILPDALLATILASIDAERLMRTIGFRPEMIQIDGGRIRAFCPIHGERVFRTLSVDAAGKSYLCQSKRCPGHAGGDLIDLYARSKKLCREDAALELAGVFGVAVDVDGLTDRVQRALDIAENYVALEAWDQAEEQYDRALGLQADSISALQGKLAIQRRAGRAEEARLALLELARVLAASGDHDEAHQLLRDHLETYPRDSEAHVLYIECIEKLGDPEWAARERVRLAAELKVLGDIDGALEVLREVEAMKLDAIDVSGEIAELLSTADRREEAIAEWERRAKSLLGEADAEGSLEALRSALEIDPDRDELRVKIAEIVAARGRVDVRLEECCSDIEGWLSEGSRGPASRTLEVLLAAFADHPRLIELKGDLESARGHTEVALEMRLKGIDLFEESHEFDQALHALEKVIDERQENVLLLSRRARLLREKGEVETAVQTYGQIATLFEESDDLQEAAGICQTLIEMEPDALEHRKRQLDLYARLGAAEVVVEKAASLADALRLREEPEEAAGVLERALEAAPRHPELLSRHADALHSLARHGEASDRYLDLAKAYLDIEELDRARHAIDRTLEMMPGHAEARELRADMMVRKAMAPTGVAEYLQLAEAYQAGGEQDAVIRLGEKILKVQPENLQAMQFMAEAYAHAGRRPEQRAMQMRLIRLYRQQHAFTRAGEVCEAILSEEETHTGAIEEMIAIAEGTRQTEQAAAMLWRLAQVHAQAGRRDEEQAVLDRILDAEPLHAGGWYRRLELLAQWATPKDLQAAVAGAIEIFIEAHQPADLIQILEDLRDGRKPKPEIVAGLAGLRRRLGETEGLKADLRELAELYKQALRDDEALEALGELSELEGDDLNLCRQRIDLLMRGQRREEAAREYLKLGRGLAELERATEAEQSYHAALKIDQTSMDAREGLFDLYVQTGNAERADEAMEDLAAHFIKAGDLRRAIEVYERALEYKPGDEDTIRKIIALHEKDANVEAATGWYNRLLDGYEKEGRGGVFEQTAQQAIALDPGNTAMRRRLADSLTGAGRTSEAEAALLGLVEVLIESSELDAAAGAVDELLDLNSNSLQGRAWRAEVMARRGNTEAALNEFRSLTRKIGAGAPGGGDPAGAFALGNYEGLTRVRAYTFANYVVGARNNFAHATALAASRAPGRNYNPLFLYADVGMGKTHLCHAIANYVLEHHPQLKIMYTMTEDFIGGLIDGIQSNAITSFRNRHRLSDILIIDDIQFLSGKERAQEEFFHIFNALYEAGKQIVITSDRPPKEISHLENRLRSRFGAGIIVDIQSPDLETRLAILQRELAARERGDAVGQDVVLYLAESIPANIRDLKGALNQLLARAEMTGATIDLTLAHQVIDQVTAGA